MSEYAAGARVLHHSLGRAHEFGGCGMHSDMTPIAPVVQCQEESVMRYAIQQDGLDRDGA
jgi:hypothetical protein